MASIMTLRKHRMFHAMITTTIGLPIHVLVMNVFVAMVTLIYVFDKDWDFHTMCIVPFVESFVCRMPSILELSRFIASYS